jgi:hypothetical protein
MFRLPVLPSCALCCLALHMLLQSAPTVPAETDLQPTFVTHQPDPHNVVLEIQELQGARGSILADSILADEQLAPATFLSSVESLAGVPSKLPTTSPPLEYAEQLRRTAKLLNEWAEKIETSR